MNNKLLKEVLKPSRIYPLILVFLMYAWWQFYLKPMQLEKNEMLHQQEGYFKTKDKTDVWNAFFSESKHTAKGICMGVVPYTIHYYDDQDRNLKPQIDSLLAVFNATFSTYDNQSLISKLNQGTSIDTTFWISDLHSRTMKIFLFSKGDFDPTVASLVGFWGFGENKEKFEKRDTSIVDSLMQYVGYSKIRVAKNQLVKADKNIIVDYGAVAKGYGVDVVAQFLGSKGIKSYMVEIGGEIHLGNPKPGQESWSLAIEDVDTYERKGKIFFKLDNCSMATSGSYRNFIQDSITGEKYNHTINPKTGFPAKNTLISVSVLHKNCLEADAWATAMMVMGVEKAKAAAKRYKLEVCLIYSEQGEFKTYYSPGFEKLISL